jgi:hypothetical protein
MNLRIVEGWIELDGERVGRLLPNLRLSLLDRLTEAFDTMEEDADYIAELEERLGRHKPPERKNEALLCRLPGAPLRRSSDGPGGRSGPDADPGGGSDDRRRRHLLHPDQRAASLE